MQFTLLRRIRAWIGIDLGWALVACALRERRRHRGIAATARSERTPPAVSTTESPADDRAGRRRPVSARRSWIALGLALVGVLALGALPAPYAIDGPGPVTDTLGTIAVDGEDLPLITIEGAETYPTEGRLDLLTVTRTGNREQQPRWLDVLSAWFDPRRVAVPLDTAFPLGTTTEAVEQANAAAMTASQQRAIAAALVGLGYDVGAELTVGTIAEGSPADGLLEEGDRIRSIDGESFISVEAMSGAIGEHGTGSPVTVAVDRAGEELELAMTPIEGRGASSDAVLGVGVVAEYDFPIDVSIRIDQVGGPSAGMMFALAITDDLTPGALNGGEHVAGTGTITADGEVGPIGGIRQKLYGALDAGAEYFLAPADNCDEVVGHVPGDLRVFAVATLDDAAAALQAIRGEADADALPTCG